MKAKRKIIIIGAGISGLSLGWFLKQHHGDNVEIRILEASERPGGQICTHRHENFIFEQGPHSWRFDNANSSLYRLIKDLKLEHQILFAGNAALNRYIYFEKSLHKIPSGIFSALFSSFAFPLLQGLWKDFTASPGKDDDESIYAFVSRRLGSSIAERLFDPLVLGIYAGDIRKLSILSTFPKLFEWERQQGNLLRGAWHAHRLKKQKNRTNPTGGICTLKNGMNTLIEVLASQLKNELHLFQPVQQLSMEGSSIAVKLATGEVFSCDDVFVAVPANSLATMIAPLAPQIAQKLNSMPTVPIAVVNVGYCRSVLQHQGFGYLIPSSEKEKILGVIWDSSAFSAQENGAQQTRLTVMLGGAHMENFEDYTEEDFIFWALRGLKEQLGIDHYPDYVRLSKIKNAIPQYYVGHADYVREIEKEIRHLSGHIHLLGNAFYGISLNDCVQHAENAANAYQV